VRYDVRLRNQSAAPQRFDFWVTATLPDGTDYGVVREPRTYVFAPGLEVRRRLRAQVPSYAPRGTYTLQMNVGRYPNAIRASARFRFRKDGAGSEEPGPVVQPLLVVEEAAASDGAYGRAASGAPPAFVGPNPAAGAATLTVALDAAAPVTVTLFDVLGRAVQRVDAGHLDAGIHRLALDVEALPGGVYLWHLDAGGHIQTGHFTLTD
jgi:hypothetical protein